MPKFIVRIAQLVRQTADVVVEAPSRKELDERLSEVWDMEDGSSDWVDDDSWGVDPGTHMIMREAPPDAEVDFTLEPD